MTILLRGLRKLWRKPVDRRGVAAVEFAIVAIPVCLVLVSIFELGLLQIAGSIMDIAVAEASRVGILGNTGTGISREQRITNIVTSYTNAFNSAFTEPRLANVNISGRVYIDFADLASNADTDPPEPYTDKNGNNQWDAGEDYTDINGNGTWDAHMRSGFGGRGTVVVYTITATYSYITAFWSRIFGSTVNFQYNVVVRNES